MNIHVSEKEIQEYALHPAETTSAVARHIQSCSLCQEQAALYLQMFTGLEKMESPVFDFDLNALVMSQLPSPKKGLSPDHIVAGFLVIFTLSFIIIPLWWFWPYVYDMFAGIYIVFIYVILAAVGLVIGYTIWESYQNYRNKMRLLNFN